MPLIAIDVTLPQLQRAKKLVDAGVYESLQQFGEIAFANQLALEDGVAPEQLADEARARRGTAPSKKPALVPKLPPKGVQKGRAAAERETTAAAPPPLEAALDFDQVCARLSGDALGSRHLAAAPTVAAPVDQRILGLVNKPFGLKLVARAILWKAGSEWPTTEGVARELGRMAATTAKEIAAEDRAAERTRGLLQTGLPTEGEESLERFSTQYVGRVSKAGQVTPGAVVQFALAAVQGGELRLTGTGLEFARLPNPVLDHGARPWASVLSDQEQRYLVQHIQAFVPGEAHDGGAVVRAVAAGENRPEALLVAVKSALPPGWTDIQARGYVSGLVTRLTELDVLNRIWTGRTVHYELSTHAPLLLNHAETKEVA